ncbi:MAG TPA: 50S ribosomal protein L15 [Phycisphaerae bacterium]|nr:50S ribosomal protein L15 [Phycisphaerae bacterium]HPS52930.1 50S ribosomal protein L15 [Phycisphaerae bacterium]
MKLDDILSAAGKYKKRKRIGRGVGSGKGKTSGRGHKGYGARAGSSRRLGYEGGQNPTIARMPQRGFNNANFRMVYQVVNVAALDAAFDNGATVDAASLKKVSLIGDAGKPVKILGNGDLSKKLTVVAAKFSASAKEKITNAGGSAEEK